MPLPTSKALRRDPAVLDKWEARVRAHPVRLVEPGEVLRSVWKLRDVFEALYLAWNLSQHDGASTTAPRTATMRLVWTQSQRDAQSSEGARRRVLAEGAASTSTAQRESTPPPRARSGVPRIVSDFEHGWGVTRVALTNNDGRSQSQNVRAGQAQLRNATLDLIEELREWMPRGCQRVIRGDSAQANATAQGKTTDAEIRHEAVIRVRAGESEASVARALDCNRSTVHRWVKAARTCNSDE